MCVPNSPLFQCCQVYDWPPFFNKKYMNGPIFLDSYVKDPIFLTSWYMHIFFTQRFFEAAYPLGITWIDYDICVITSKKWVQKIKGQYMNRSTFWMIKYMNGSLFLKARYMNGVGFEILAHTPVPKLPISYPPPPPPPPPTPPTHKILAQPNQTGTFQSKLPLSGKFQQMTNRWYFSYSSQKTGFDISCSCLWRKQFAWNVKTCFLRKIRNKMSADFYYPEC